MTEHKHIYLANSMNSLRIEGQKTISIEIVQQFDWEVPDWVVLPGGNLGNVSAFGKGFLMMYDLGSDLEIAADLRRASGKRQSALSFLSDKFRAFRSHDGAQDSGERHSDRQSGECPQSDRDAAALQRCRRASLGVGAGRGSRSRRPHRYVQLPHTGVALAALRKLVEKKVIRGHERVVVISTANGLKFADQKIAYHASALPGIRGTLQNRPVEVVADPKHINDAIARYVERVRLLDG